MIAVSLTWKLCTSAVDIRTCAEIKKIKIFFSPYLTEEQAVSRWETGVSYPDVAMIPQIAKYLNISADKLLGCENTEIIERSEPLNQSQIDSIFDYVPGKKVKGKKVLVVDDAKFMRMMLKDILSADGQIVIEAENGAECLEILQNEQVDICILDINMSVMDGMVFIINNIAQNCIF